MADQDLRPEDVCTYWLGELDEDGLAPPEVAARWWRGSAELDAEVRGRFLGLHRRATRGELDDWRSTPWGCLALILLLDQFPRNMFRGEATAFATDEIAVARAREAIDRGLDRLLQAHECCFLYIPFMHSESLCDQHLGMRLYGLLVERLAGRAREEVAGNLDFMRRHFEIVERFRRFPHRNAVLGRVSTAEELAFLALPGSSF
jgi:uncharacterized protein (DUF924 family)